MSRYTSATDADRKAMLAEIGVESVKAVSDVVAPLSGEIVEVNETLAEAPEQINDDPYGAGWMVKVRLSNVDEVEQLMDASAYEGTLT